MAGNGGPDPMEFFQRLFGEMFGQSGGSSASPADVWRRATEPKPEASPSPSAQRENLMFALATRAVEALEDIALNAAAMRQMQERREGGYVRPATQPYVSRPGLGDEPRSD